KKSIPKRCFPYPALSTPQEVRPPIGSQPWSKLKRRIA
ncbi:tetratricopeptide repeat family protein, partial [Vibrio parahaemolyticus V-223/04]